MLDTTQSFILQGEIKVKHFFLVNKISHFKLHHVRCKQPLKRSTINQISAVCSGLLWNSLHCTLNWKRIHAYCPDCVFAKCTRGVHCTQSPLWGNRNREWEFSTFTTPSSASLCTHTLIPPTGLMHCTHTHTVTHTITWINKPASLLVDLCSLWISLL